MFTKELPQTILGYTVAIMYNMRSEIQSVSYYGGATAIERTFHTRSDFTLGNFIFGERGVTADPNNKVFQHEYGSLFTKSVCRMELVQQIRCSKFPG
ncbi:hypothetical protein GCM10022392_32530 [Mucilaginibacter panaciglaebae]|uniref:Uncharacterized protein n=1 Tax=Mucilaginibacter panaciglaebae TaxID=502331 RepID=A0ABP7X4W0_9SPHI